MSTESVVINQPPTQTVKLVIWDLDDTFWSGTLSEGPVTAIEDNIVAVKQLASRGIVSTICSKNDFDLARKELESLDVWLWFVFASIQWSSKGQVIADLIDRMNLRAENVVFVDDNVSNLQDAAFYNPGITCCSDPQQLQQWLVLPPFHGKDDAALSRLAEYKQLEQRDHAKTELGLTNVDFLRQSDIVCEISYDVDQNFDRIVELVNRANQLNFTKQRLDTANKIAEFREQLSAFGYKAGIVRVRDRYADYGVAGFFLIQTTFQGATYKHFVFSCRILNMGVEQYVDDFLKSPKLEIKPPVANPVKTFEQVDWISDSGSGSPSSGLQQYRVLVVGGCDMLQLATYCSSNSAEFTNRPKGDQIVRFDDPAFFLGSIEEVRASEVRAKIPAPTADEMQEFADELPKAQVVVLSLYEMLSTTYFRGKDGLVVRFFTQTLKDILRGEQALWFVRNFQFDDSSLDIRMQRVAMSVQSVLRRTANTTPVFLLDESTRVPGLPEWEVKKRERYNLFVSQLCDQHDRLHRLPASELIQPEWAIDIWHYSRQAYLTMAQYITEQLETIATAE